VDGAEGLWNACAELLRGQVSDAVWHTTFTALQPVERTGSRLVIAVPSSLAKERIEGRYLALVKGSLADLGEPELDVVIEVRPTRSDDPSRRGHPFDARDTVDAYDQADLHVDVLTMEDPDLADEPATVGASAAPAVRAPDAAHPKYTFDAFVTGASNRFAHAAALSVAETPARSYNPLFIYGDAGLGKTHLLQAIAHYVHEHYPGFVVRYVSTETFLNQFVDAIRTNTTRSEFKRRYRDVDVLLLDDIQFIEGKEGLQEELFHTFNHLHAVNRQIVLSSDRPPDAIPRLEDRLRSRFMMGLITDIQPPNLETRLAILRKKAESERTPVAPDVLEFIATNVTDNIRVLEGALIRVSAYAKLTDAPLTTELAQQVLSDIISGNQPRPITATAILDATALQFGFTVDELKSKRRQRPLVVARQIGMYVMRHLTDLSYPGIAREFGGRDHTTVIHAVDKIDREMKERRQVYDQVTELMQTLGTPQ
jgi:chromosomal replication initiator protein